MLFSPAVVPAMGERRAGWWIVSQLMRRMGMDVPPHVPEAHDAPGADEAMLAVQMAGARCGFEELAAAGTVTMPMQLPAPWVDRHIERIGGWRLAPERLIAAWYETRKADEAAMHEPPTLRFIPRRQRRKLNASLSFLGSPADIILHPEDAARRGVEHGRRVRVRTDRGEILLTANVSEAIRPGVASIPHGHEIANVNLLTSVEHVDPMTGMVRYTGIPIEVEPITDEPVLRAVAT
jgi:anaerobic selenocysteine-containing dehydrogenase